MTLEPRVAKIRKPGEEPQNADISESDVLRKAVAEDQKPISKKGATGRELRRARRKARRLGLEPVDDHDAIRMLKERGIDHNADDSIMEMLPNEQTQSGENPDEGLVQLPAETLKTGIATKQDNTGFLDEATRAFEIASIQKQLVKRRRRRLALLFVKLAFFIALPTFLVGNYYYKTASDMFETKSEFVIQKSEASGAGGGIGGFLAGTGFAAAQDSIAVQGYLTSREAMLRLNDEQGFATHFQQDGIDDIQRLEPDATDEQAYKLFKKRVKVGFDPSEGIVRMEVIAASPEASQRFSSALITYAEERVDQLSARIRQDQMSGATAAYQNAEQAVKDAQTTVLELQQQRGVLSAEAEISAQMSIINSLELEREAKFLDLAEMRANARPNETRIAVLNAEIERMTTRIDELRLAMTQNTDSKTSLATITGELTVAEADLTNRQLMLQTALQQVIDAQIEADRQVRYLSLNVAPIAPDVASYPRKLENTILAFIIFSSIYILVSLTVSILREQVSV